MTILHGLTVDRAEMTESRSWISRLGTLLLLATLASAAPWRAQAVGPTPATNRVALTWGSIGTGTRYYIQTSTNLQTWTAATNTTATNANLAFVGDKMRTFRVAVSNAPTPSAALAWNASVPSTGIIGYSIYYGVSSKNYTNAVTVGLGTNAVISNLVAGMTYYFATTARASSGLESDLSNEATWQQNPLRLQLQRLP